MRISDWSSDVCSSDLLLDRRALPGTEAERGLGVGGGAHFDGALDKMDDRPPPRQIDLEDRPKRGGFTSRGFNTERPRTFMRDREARAAADKEIGRAHV